MKMLKSLKRDFSLTYLFITHDLAVIDYMADFMAVMYLGQIMEIGSKNDIFLSPLHPYTLLLLNSIPDPDPEKEKEKSPP